MTETPFAVDVISVAEARVQAQRLAEALDVSKAGHASLGLRREGMAAQEFAFQGRAALVLDGAGRHSNDKLIVPDSISLVKLPPYAPGLNPIENVWAYLRGTKLVHRLFKNHKDIVDACRDAWNTFVVDEKTVRSITARRWATCQDL